MPTFSLCVFSGRKPSNLLTFRLQTFIKLWLIITMLRDSKTIIWLLSWIGCKKAFIFWVNQGHHSTKWWTLKIQSNVWLKELLLWLSKRLSLTLKSKLNWKNIWRESQSFPSLTENWVKTLLCLSPKTTYWSNFWKRLTKSSAKSVLMTIPQSEFTILFVTQEMKRKNRSTKFANKWVTIFGKIGEYVTSGLWFLQMMKLGIQHKLWNWSYKLLADL